MPKITVKCPKCGELTTHVHTANWSSPQIKKQIKAFVLSVHNKVEHKKMSSREYRSGLSPFSNYDSWKTTDPRDGADGGLDRAKCAFWYEIDDEGYSQSHFCDVPYEDHDDEALGHEFVMPEPEGRDY